MVGPPKDDPAARDRAKMEFEEAQRKMAEELGDTLPGVASEGEADRAAVEWERNDSPRTVT
jgi:hypothetical protein